MNIQIKRRAAGSYIATKGELEVRIDYCTTAEGFAFTGWVARATWGNSSTDPVATLRDAKISAVDLLNSAI